MGQAPCKTCPMRGCGSKHDTCRLYQAYRRGREEELRQQKENHEVVSVVIEACKKEKVRQHKKRRM